VDTCFTALRAVRTQFHRPVLRIRCIRMGRRSRQRELRPNRDRAERGDVPPAGSSMAVARSRMARVQVDDQTWSAFRASLGAMPASVALGRLVEREVAAVRRRSVADAEAVSAAVQEARSVAKELSDLIDRLEAGRSPAKARGAR
jgi:hypothetical protein